MESNTSNEKNPKKALLIKIDEQVPNISWNGIARCTHRLYIIKLQHKIIIKTDITRFIKIILHNDFM